MAGGKVALCSCSDDVAGSRAVPFCLSAPRPAPRPLLPCPVPLPGSRIHNADIHMADDYDLDDLVDTIEGSRIYVPAIYVVNKIDQITIEELEVMDK